MQEEIEHQQQTSLDGFGDNTFVDSPHRVAVADTEAADTDFITNNKINRYSFTKGSHLDINKSNSIYCQNTPVNMESNVETEGNDHINAESKIKSSIGVNLRVTGQCCQGGRKYMEDFFSVAYQQTDNLRDLEYAFIGIYDGHGGSEAATFAKEHLMMEIINQKLFWSDNDQDILRAIREGYIATHFAMWREQENWPKTTNGLLSTAGTTATVAFLRNEKIYIGHVGDSGVVLGYQNEGENVWRAKQLTTDHKPESPAERRRIVRAGGKVGVKSGVPRVVWTRPRYIGHRGPVRANTPVEEIPFLAVARSLGDLWSYNAEFNEFVVSPDPDVQVIDINPKTFRCLIFGTDGLWNVVTPQEAVDTVCNREKMNESMSMHAQNKQENDAKNVNWINPSKGLVELALRTWSDKKMRADNTSVVTVILYPPPGNSAVETNVTKAKSVNDEDFATQLLDKPSFQEISAKYLRPESFRYINTATHYENDHMYWSSTENEAMKTTFYWRCDAETETENKNVPEAQVERNLQSFDELSKPKAMYTNTTSAVNIESVEKLNTDHNDLYVNSFAETYNSLLDARSSKEQAVPVADESAATSSPLSSSSGLQMQQILQEQQMYQQQCMSGEDGYMLTTLETRREQQQQQQPHFAAQNDNSFNDSIQLNLRNESISYMVNTVETKELIEDVKEKENATEEPKENKKVLVREETFDEDQAKGEVSRVLAFYGAYERSAEEKAQQQEKERRLKHEAELLVEQQQKQQIENQRICMQKYEEFINSEAEFSIPSLVEDEDGLIEGDKVSAESAIKEKKTVRECHVHIIDVSYENREQIATPTVFEERIDKIEILADKPELVIETSPTTSKAKTTKIKNDLHAKAAKSPYYMPRSATGRPKPKAQSTRQNNNAYSDNFEFIHPTQEQFDAYIKSTSDAVTACAFAAFVAGSKTDTNASFDPRKMRSNAKTNASNQNNAGKGPMPGMSGQRTAPTMNGNGPTPPPPMGARVPNARGCMPNMFAMPKMSDVANIFGTLDMSGMGNIPGMDECKNIDWNKVFNRKYLAEFFYDELYKTKPKKKSQQNAEAETDNAEETPNMFGMGNIPNLDDFGDFDWNKLLNRKYLAEFFYGEVFRTKISKKPTTENGNSNETAEDEPDLYEYCDSLVEGWTPFMKMLEDPDFQRRILKSSDITIPVRKNRTEAHTSTNARKNTTSTCATTTTTTTTTATNITNLRKNISSSTATSTTTEKTVKTHTAPIPTNLRKNTPTATATTTATNLPTTTEKTLKTHRAPLPTNLQKNTTTATATTTNVPEKILGAKENSTTEAEKVKPSVKESSKSPADATDTKESSKVLPKKQLRTKTKAEATVSTKTLTAQKVKEKEVKTPATKTVTGLKPKSKVVSASIKPTTVPLSGTAKKTVATATSSKQILTRAAKRPTVESTRNIKTTIGSTSSTTTTETADAIPVKRSKR